MVDDVVAEHVDGAPPIELGGRALDDPRLSLAGITAVELDEPMPGVGLGQADEREEVFGVDAPDGSNAEERDARGPLTSS